MDPRKRDQQREEERKASLRKASNVVYSPIDEAHSDSPDLRREQQHAAAAATAAAALETSSTSPVASPGFRFSFDRNTEYTRQSLDTRLDRIGEERVARDGEGGGGGGGGGGGESRPRFSWLQAPPGTNRNTSREPSPHSPYVSSANDQNPFDSMGPYEDVPHSDSTGGRVASVKARGNSSEEESEHEELKNVPLSGVDAQRSDLPAWQKGKKKQNIGKNISENLTAFKNFILRRKTTVSEGLGRELPVDVTGSTPRIDIRTNGAYLHNSIRSSKYSYWSFLPRQILFQFSKFANIYFLCISILQMIPGLSTTGTYTTIIPLMVFVTISMAKEGFEDMRRHKLDKAENRAETTRAKGASWETVQWQNVRVGDVLRLERDKSFPADVVLLHVQGAEDRAYVETMALDGETNLKNKGAPTILQKMHLSAEETLARNDISMHVEDPNLDLYNFSGNIAVADEKLPLVNDNVVYRGSILRNTQQVLGMVVYTGEECKIRMNANKRPRIKAPRMQSVVNKVVLFIVALVLFLSILLSILYTVWLPNEKKAFYLKEATVAIVQVFVSFIIMLNTMIPLSLYVSMEIVKVCQIGWMMGDIEMYDPVTNTPMEAKTSTINEELGQITHVFSDKTGTLTDNIMKFRKLSVAGTSWLHHPEAAEEEEEYSEYAVTGKDYKRVERPSLDGTPMMGKTEDLIRMVQENPHTDFARAARFFILSIALCHTCVSEKAEEGFEYSATSPDEVALAQAAQEMGFIFVDKKAGTAIVRMPSADGSIIEEHYQVLEVLEFSSKRKRMSLIVRMPDGKVCVFTKGADSIVKELLRETELTQQSTAKVERSATVRKSIEAQDFMRRKSVQQARSGFGRTSKSLARQSIITDADNLPPLSPMSPRKMDFGPRTSTMDFAHSRKSWHGPDIAIDSVTSPTTMSSTASRLPHHVLSHVMEDGTSAADNGPPQSEAADTFEKCFQHIDYFATDGLRTLLYAYKFVDDHEYTRWSKIYHEASTSLTDREKKIESAAALIEQSLELAGATAIEDKLQDGVPLTIDRLRRANIKVWVLTGDKRETAINIGKSCQLIKDFSKVAIIDHTLGDVFLQIQSALTMMREAVHSVVVVDGQTLSMIEEDEPLFDFFHALAVFVDSVLCCRASPAQKAFLVKSIRTRVPSSVTLAIGDGSNDVAMIQEAHVGIGIAGREGLQAARTSDYSIAQFRFLARLLLVHGRWNYLRICKYTLATFWKEMLFFLTQSMYQMYNGYTGTSLYESISLSMFNTLFTSLPVIFLGVFEKDLEAETLMAVPELYNYGQRSRGFNLKVYTAWAAMAAGNAALVFYLPLTLYGQAPFKRDPQLYAFGTLCYTAAVLVINFKIQFWEIHYKTFMAALALLLEIGGWFLWQILLSLIYVDNTIYKVKDGFIHHFGRDGLWWLTLILTVAMCFAFEMMVKMTRQVVLTNDVDVHQKLEKDPAIWRYIEQAAHAGELHEEPGSHQRVPPKRTKTQQVRRDAEYQSLLTRNRSSTIGSRGSVENIRHMPGKLVRFLTRESDNKSTLHVPEPDYTPGASPAITPVGTPGPSWSRAGNNREDIEMADYFADPAVSQSLPAKGRSKSDSAV